VAIFEAVHGSAPKYAGKNVINPTAMIMSGAMMLRYLTLFKEAAMIENAVVYTLEEGKAMPRDVVGDAKAASTTAYTDAIIANFGKAPSRSQAREYKPIRMPEIDKRPDFVRPTTRRVVGVDVFIESALTPDEIGKGVTALVEGTPVLLKIVSSRGTKVYPSMGAITDTVDQFRCRLMQRDTAGGLKDEVIVSALQKIGAHYRWAHIEKLQEFDGNPGFTKAQGED
jgi:isocitrate dehydrogenase